MQGLGLAEAVLTELSCCLKSNRPGKLAAKGLPGKHTVEALKLSPIFADMSSQCSLMHGQGKGRQPVLQRWLVQPTHFIVENTEEGLVVLGVRTGGDL